MFSIAILIYHAFKTLIDFRNQATSQPVGKDSRAGHAVLPNGLAVAALWRQALSVGETKSSVVGLTCLTNKNGVFKQHDK